MKNLIVWNKGGFGMGDLKSQFAPTYELAVFATKGRAEFPGARPKDVIDVPSVGSGQIEHPNEKPVDLMEYLVRHLTEPGDSVLDPFAGSCPVGVACKRLGRSYTGFELMDEYYELGTRRLGQPQSQSLF